MKVTIKYDVEETTREWTSRSDSGTRKEKQYTDIHITTKPTNDVDIIEHVNGIMSQSCDDGVKVKQIKDMFVTTPQTMYEFDNTRQCVLFLQHAPEVLYILIDDDTDAGYWRGYEGSYYHTLPTYVWTTRPGEEYDKDKMLKFHYNGDQYERI